MKKLLFSLVIFLLVSLLWVVPSTDDALTLPEQRIFADDAQQVKILEPDFIRSAGPLKISSAPRSWGTERVGIKKMEKSILMNSTIIVAVIDTGIDYTHTHLKDRIVSGYDFIADNTDPKDVHFHGTHVAGIIVDSTPAAVKIMPIRALNEEGKGYDSTIAKAIRFAVDNGADIINMSFGGEEFSQYLSDAIDYALSKNVLIVVAAGNDSATTEKYYPASEQKVIVVSAADQNDNIASFSNTGESIDISAPGVNIVSSIPGQQFGSMNGTSMAAPFVSAVAALIKLDDPRRSIQDIERLLKKYVDDRGAKGWDTSFGEGIINVASFDEIKNVPPIVNAEDNTFTVEKGENLIIDLSRYVTDDDGDDLTYSADAGVLRGNMLTFTSSIIGEQTVSVEVTDGKSESINFILKITVEPKRLQIRASKFKDVPATFWSHDEISFLTDMKVINGYPDDSFNPNANVTKAQASLMVARALGVANLKASDANFKDVSSKTSGYQEIWKLVEMGIIDKGADFKPYSLITRGEMAMMLYRAYGFEGEYAGKFTDVGNSLKPAVNALAANGITNPQTSYFNPNNNLTRAHFATFIARVQHEAFRFDSSAH